jgi:ABC-2 type transport system permease protein
MIADIFTVAAKEIKELPYLRKDKSRTNLFSLLIFLGLFGILLPWQTGRAWVTSPLNMLSWAWLPFMMVGTTMVDSFAGERERHTLETLLASRLSDRVILFGKILAGIVYGVVITLGCVLIGLGTINLLYGQGSLLVYPAPIAVGIVAEVLLVSTLASGLGVLVSLRAASVRQAQQTFTVAYFAIFIPIIIFPLLPAAVTGRITEFFMRSSFVTIAVVLGIGVAVIDTLLILAALARFKRSRLVLD